MPDTTWTGIHAYDTAGRLYSIDNANPTSGTEPDWYVSSILYNARGQVTQVEKGDFVRTTYAYSAPRGWLDSINAGYGAGWPPPARTKRVADTIPAWAPFSTPCCRVRFSGGCNATMLILLAHEHGIARY